MLYVSMGYQVKVSKTKEATKRNLNKLQNGAQSQTCSHEWSFLTLASLQIKRRIYHTKSDYKSSQNRKQSSREKWINNITYNYDFVILWKNWDLFQNFLDSLTSLQERRKKKPTYNSQKVIIIKKIYKSF
jgi:hypothetical protein